MAGYRINQLPQATTVSTGDQIPVWVTDEGSPYRASMNTLLSFFESNFASPEFTVQTAAPLSGATQTIGAVVTNVWLILNPAGTLASLTIALPPSTSAVDGQIVMVSTSQEITTLIVTASGASMSGVPAGLRLGESFTLRYNTAALTWYVVSATDSYFTTATIATAIDDANGNELVKFGTTASAVNEVTITNAASGGTPSIQASGDDTNVGLTLASKGTGKLTVAGGVGATVEIGNSFDTISVLSNLTSTARVESATLKHTASSTVAAIPSAVTAGAGARRYVTDASVVANVGATLTGGGSLFLPVYSDGTVWRYG
jgi:hypothetical protein